MSKDLDKKQLIESIQTLLEIKDPHIHLNQQKLFTLVSIGFQYLLYLSTQEKGHYLIRIEDGILAEKLAKRAKDPSTRKFLREMLLPRKIKFQSSVFFLDYFHPQSWRPVKSYPLDNFKSAMIIRNTTRRPLAPETAPDEDSENNTQADLSGLPFPPDFYFLSNLQEQIPRTITIAFDLELPRTKQVRFPFIKDYEADPLSGVTISSNVDVFSPESS